MKHQRELEAESTHGRIRLLHGCAPLRGMLRLATGCALLLLSACPQMLDDEFDLVPSDEVYGNAGTSSRAGVGGSDRGGSGGVAGSSSAGSGGGAGSGVGGGVQPGQVGVLSTVPADGATGVLPDTALLFTFSAPMDTGTVEAAYSSGELPRGQVSFAWSDGDTVLRIQPNAPLQVAEGTDRALVEASSYAVRISAQARDKQGQPLAEKQISFSVARSITQTLTVVQDRDLTGNWRSDNSYGIVECERGDTTICVGDGALTAESDPAYKALMTFDLTALPSDAIQLTAAELSLIVSNVLGSPFADLGTLHIEHVEFSSIGDAAFADTPLSAQQLMSTGADIGDRVSAGVLAGVLSDWDARSHSQYRLFFETPTNEDDAPDHLVCSWNTAQLDVTYLLP